MLRDSSMHASNTPSKLDLAGEIECHLQGRRAEAMAQLGTIEQQLSIEAQEDEARMCSHTTYLGPKSSQVRLEGFTAYNNQQLIRV